MAPSNFKTFDDEEVELREVVRIRKHTRVVACLGLSAGLLWGLSFLGTLGREEEVRLRSERRKAARSRRRGLLPPWYTAVGVDVTRWAVGDGALRLDAHYVPSQAASAAYAYWRLGLNAPHMFENDDGGDEGVAAGLNATTYAYGSAGALLKAVIARRLAPRSLVFVDVYETALDTRWVAAADAKLGSEFTHRAAVTVGDSLLDASALDPACVYAATPSLVLRSALLRSLLSYDDPLTIVVTGDVACRLGALFPGGGGAAAGPTRHTVILANEASAHQCSQEKAFSWWPNGLETMPTETSLEAVAALTVPLPAADRVYLLTITGELQGDLARDLSMESAVIAQALVAVATTAQLDLDLAGPSSDSVPDVFTLTYEASSGKKAADRVKKIAKLDSLHGEEAAIAASAFTVCAVPGDASSSFSSSSRITPIRVLTALLLGSIPVVDVTYRRQKRTLGCADPAAFWLEGTKAFPHKAPFVFVEDWADLPAALAAVVGDAEPDRPGIQRRLDDVAAYRAKLERHLRGAVVLEQKKPSHRTTNDCHTAELSRAQHLALQGRVDAYYANPAWFDEAAAASYGLESDSSPLCAARNFATPEEAPVDRGALCFDAACAPSTVTSFTCLDSS